MSNDEELRQVYSAANVQEAHLIKSALDDEGIESRVEGQNLQNAVGDLPWVAIAPRVLVHAKDFDRARQLIAEHELVHQQSDATAEEWTCSECGESNEPTFDLCWNCQTSRPQ